MDRLRLPAGILKELALQRLKHRANTLSEVNIHECVQYLENICKVNLNETMIEKLEKLIGGFEKGQYISPEILENLIKEEIASPKYQFKILKLIQKIKNKFSERGAIATINIYKSGIKILTDSEASKENTKRIAKGLRVLEQAQTDLIGVDVNNLDRQEEEIHNKRIVFGSRVIDAIKTEFKKDIPLKLSSYRYKLPRLFK